MSARYYVNEDVIWEQSTDESWSLPVALLRKSELKPEARSQWEAIVRAVLAR